MTIDFSRCRLVPFAHQREDAATLVEKPYFFVASEMRTGKTKVVIDAAQFLFEAKKIDRVVVVAPAAVRDVWADQRLGELAKHLWVDLPALVHEYHARTRTWLHGPLGEPRLTWVVTNYEFIRSRPRLDELLPTCDAKTLLVLDESSFVKSYSAAQTKACAELRRLCGRVVLLNGTPIFHNPEDLFSQANILHPSILDCRFITHFRARYAVEEVVRGYGGKPIVNKWGKAVKRVASWTNLDDLQRRLVPHTVRRLQAECLDLPPKLDSVALTATLMPETWMVYKTLQDEAVAWFGTEVATAATAAVKVMRLSQVTGGCVGGVEDGRIGESPVDEGLLDDVVIPDISYEIDKAQNEYFHPSWPLPPVKSDSGSTRFVGREKLDVLLWFLGQRLAEDPCVKVVVWCRFHVEVDRILTEVKAAHPHVEIAAIYGSQSRADRLRVFGMLKPETAPAGPVVVAGVEGTGSFGLDFTASHTCVTYSSGYSPGRSRQTLDRVYGPGQQHPVAYYSILAVGPRGQRTIDHAIEEARRAGEDVATWTSDAWVRAIRGGVTR